MSLSIATGEAYLLKDVLLLRELGDYAPILLMIGVDVRDAVDRLGRGTSAHQCTSAELGSYRSGDGA